MTAERVLAALLVSVLAAGQAAAGDHCASHSPPSRQVRYLKSTHRYDLPAVTLLDQDGRSVPLDAALRQDAPVALNFIFTTCTTICPVMSATFSALRKTLGREAGGLELISISIDPEHDRPEALKRYARRFGADPAWRFYTGGADDIRRVLAAFDALAGDKGNHRPITLFRRAHGKEWVRLEGFASSQELAAELREMRAEK